MSFFLHSQETVTIQCKKTQGIVPLLVAILFLAGGFMLLRGADAVIPLLIGVFDLALAYLYFAPNHLCFRYGPEGIEVVQPLKKIKAPWHQIERFQTASHGLIIRRNNRLAIRFKDDSEHAKKARGVNKHFVTWDFMLPFTLEGNTADLVHDLNVRLEASRRTTPDSPTFDPSV